MSSLVEIEVVEQPKIAGILLKKRTSDHASDNEIEPPRKKVCLLNEACASSNSCVSENMETDLNDSIRTRSSPAAGATDSGEELAKSEINNATHSLSQNEELGDHNLLLKSEKPVGFYCIGILPSYGAFSDSSDTDNSSDSDGEPVRHIDLTGRKFCSSLAIAKAISLARKLAKNKRLK